MAVPGVPRPSRQRVSSWWRMAKHLTPPLSVAPIPARRWKPFSTPCQARQHDSKDFQVHAQPRLPQFDHITLYLLIFMVSAQKEQEQVVAALLFLAPCDSMRSTAWCRRVVEFESIFCTVHCPILPSVVQVTFSCSGTPETLAHMRKDPWWAAWSSAPESSAAVWFWSWVTQSAVPFTGRQRPTWIRSQERRQVFYNRARNNYLQESGKQRLSRLLFCFFRFRNLYKQVDTSGSTWQWAQCVATHGNAWQHMATHGSAWQHMATYCHTWQRWRRQDAHWRDFFKILAPWPKKPRRSWDRVPARMKWPPML